MQIESSREFLTTTDNGGQVCDHASDQLPDWKESNGDVKRITARGPDGIPYVSLTSSLTCGPRGPPLLMDTECIGLLQNYVRKNTPLRIVGSRGCGAFATFKLTNPNMDKYTTASIFQPQNRDANSNSSDSDVSILIRFGLSDKEKVPDSFRQLYTMALKFYTKDGNYDILCNSLPVFFFRDPINFPSLNTSSFENPQSCGELNEEVSVWDFTVKHPESAYITLLLFSDSGLLTSHRRTHFYPVNTFKLVNSSGKSFFVRYTFRTNHEGGLQYLTDEQAAIFRKADPDFAIRDMFNAIASKDYPSWTWYMQIMEKDEVAQYSQKTGWSPFDVTKIWPQSLYPLIEIGQIQVTRTVDNHYEQVESVAFNPGNMIPGIEAPIEDVFLQARIFAYNDAQIFRLGVNKCMIPCNRPNGLMGIKGNDPPHFCTYFRGGRMNYMDEPATGQGGAPAYYPNNFGGSRSAKKENEVKDVQTVSGELNYYDRISEGEDEFDNFGQARIYYRDIMKKGEKERVAERIAESILGIPRDLRNQVIQLMSKVSVDLRQRIEKSVENMEKEGE